MDLESSGGEVVVRAPGLGDGVPSCEVSDPHSVPLDLLRIEYVAWVIGVFS